MSEQKSTDAFGSMAYETKADLRRFWRHHEGPKARCSTPHMDKGRLLCFSRMVVQPDMDAISVRGCVDDRWSSTFVLDVRCISSGDDTEKGVGASLDGHPVPEAEVQRGYKLHDRVLRPAIVVVGKGKGEGDDGKEEAEEKEGKKDTEAGGKGEA